MIPNYENEDPVLHYCLDNNFSFTIKIIRDEPISFVLAYYDYQNNPSPDVFEIMKEMLCKQAGVLLHAMRSPKSDKVLLAKKNHHEGYKNFTVLPIPPNGQVPAVLELLKREEHQEHDPLRWELLKWIIDEEKLSSHDLTNISTFYLLDILVLVFMTSKRFVSAVEADLILISIKDVETNQISSTLENPFLISLRGFHISMLFNALHMHIADSLEVTGLTSFKVIFIQENFGFVLKFFVWFSQKFLNFDGVHFQKIFLEYENNNFDTAERLEDINSFCIYR